MNMNVIWTSSQVGVIVMTTNPVKRKESVTPVYRGLRHSQKLGEDPLSVYVSICPRTILGQGCHHLLSSHLEYICNAFSPFEQGLSGVIDEMLGPRPLAILDNQFAESLWNGVLVFGLENRRS